MVVPAVLLIYIIEEFVDIDLDNHAVSELANTLGIGALVLVGGIFIPFLEEIIFRLPLNYKRNYLFKFTGSIIGKERVRKFWFKYYTAFFYLFILAFAVIHITNYKDESIGILLLTPILVLPQVIGGTVMAYLRMHLGFFWGFLQHAIFNSTFMIIAFYANVEEKVMIDNEDFKLKIEVAQNRFGQSKTINIKKNIDYISEFETKYATLNQIAEHFGWENLDSVKNYQHFNINLEIKNSKINSDSLLKHHLIEIIED
jgi:hypothetical protein